MKPLVIVLKNLESKKYDANNGISLEYPRGLVLYICTVLYIRFCTSYVTYDYFSCFTLAEDKKIKIKTKERTFNKENPFT